MSTRVNAKRVSIQDFAAGLRKFSEPEFILRIRLLTFLSRRQSTRIRFPPIYTGTASTTRATS
jgi:hypothetical protein